MTKNEVLSNMVEGIAYTLFSVLCINGMGTVVMLGSDTLQALVLGVFLNIVGVTLAIMMIYFVYTSYKSDMKIIKEQ